MVVSAVERAFELARSGTCKDILAIKKQLDREGLNANQIMGKLLRSQLNRAIREALAPSGAATHPRDDNPPTDG